MSIQQPRKIITSSNIGGDIRRGVKVPGPPLSLQASPSINGKTAKLSFLHPSFDGGSPITNYIITSIPDNITINKPAAAGQMNVMITGLSMGKDYTFTVKAVNSIGESPASQPSNKIITTTVPNPPIINSIENIDSKTVRIRFTPPSFNGGREITSYIAESTSGNLTGTAMGAYCDSIVIKNIDPNQPCSFTVRATNNNGTSLKSNISDKTKSTKSLNELIDSAVDSRIKDVAPGVWNERFRISDYEFKTYNSTAPQSMFSKLNYPKSIERNKNCWAKDLDLTGMGIFNCSYPPSPIDNSKAWPGYPGYGTLISKRHVIYAAHAQLGDSISFAKKDGTIVNKRIKAWSPLLQGSGDIKLGVLTEEVDSDICFYKILPPNYKNKISRPFTAIGTNQFKELIVLECDEFGHYVSPKDTKRLSFNRFVITGDSGSPVFIIIDNELVLLNCWWHPGLNGLAPDGPFIANFKAQINLAMSELDKQAGYKNKCEISEIDLSKYNDI